MDDGHCPARPPWSELLGIFGPVIPRIWGLTDGGMVEPGRIDRDLVPTLNRACRIDQRPWPTAQINRTTRGATRIGLKTRPKGVYDPAGKSVRQDNAGGSQDQ